VLAPDSREPGLCRLSAAPALIGCPSRSRVCLQSALRLAGASLGRSVGNGPYRVGAGQSARPVEHLQLRRRQELFEVQGVRDGARCRVWLRAVAGRPGALPKSRAFPWPGLSPGRQRERDSFHIVMLFTHRWVPPTTSRAGVASVPLDSTRTSHH